MCLLQGRVVSCCSLVAPESPLPDSGWQILLNVGWMLILVNSTALTSLGTKHFWRVVLPLCVLLVYFDPKMKWSLPGIRQFSFHLCLALLLIPAIWVAAVSGEIHGGQDTDWDLRWLKSTGHKEQYLLLDRCLDQWRIPGEGLSTFIFHWLPQLIGLTVAMVHPDVVTGRLTGLPFRAGTCNWLTSYSKD